MQFLNQLVSAVLLILLAPLILSVNRHPRRLHRHPRCVRLALTALNTTRLPPRLRVNFQVLVLHPRDDGVRVDAQLPQSARKGLRGSSGSSCGSGSSSSNGSTLGSNDSKLSDNKNGWFAAAGATSQQPQNYFSSPSNSSSHNSVKSGGGSSGSNSTYNSTAQKHQ